jgi:accessory colonization factor AcfC
VRKGNPKGIKSLEDLTTPGIYLLDVNGEGGEGLWEDLAGRKGLIPEIQKRIAITVETSAEAIENWKAAPALDAWITFESWHYRLKDISDLVKIPRDETVYRGTAAVATHFHKNREPARKFLELLKTPPCQAVFEKWGWKQLPR